MARETTHTPTPTLRQRITALEVGQEEVGEFWAGHWSVARNADGWTVTVSMTTEVASPAWTRTETFDSAQAAIGAVEAFG